MFCLWRPDWGLGPVGRGCCGRGSLFRVHTQRSTMSPVGPSARQSLFADVEQASCHLVSIPPSHPAALLLCTNTHPCHFFRERTRQPWLLRGVKKFRQGREMFVVIHEWWKPSRIVCFWWHCSGYLQSLNRNTPPKDTGEEEYENESRAPLHYHTLSQCERCESVRYNSLVHRVNNFLRAAAEDCAFIDEEHLYDVALEDSGVLQKKKKQHDALHVSNPPLRSNSASSSRNNYEQREQNNVR